MATEPLRGVDALEHHALGLRQAFPDLSIEATAPPLVRGEHICIPWRALGTHRRDLGAMLPATERFVTLHGLHYVELTDGAVRRARGFFDLYDAATQLGVLPARGGLGETALLLLRGFGLRRRSSGPIRPRSRSSNASSSRRHSPIGQHAPANRPRLGR